MSPRAVPARSLFAVFALALLALPGSASAEAGTLADLRARLEAARANRPAAVPEGTLVSIEHVLETAAAIEERHPTAAPIWRRRAERYLEAVAEGRDPYVEERGKITNRGYRSPVSQTLQGYAVYLPPDYDPSRSYPLYVALHGGSSNGNLFLGVVLGNNMDWLTYSQHLYDEYTPRWSPDWIVVAPTGFGQMLWRWMAERDVLDVIADVERHYNVDPDRIVLGGLSNGGVGAYTIGSRHASRFAAVQAMAGAPSWILFAGGGTASPDVRAELSRYSAMELAENLTTTDFRFYHGRVDPGPMRPQFIDMFVERLRERGVIPQLTWYAAGHDILYMVHRHGGIYERLSPLRRDRRPDEVRLVTGDYRANRQHWVTATRIAEYPRLAKIHAKVEGAVIVVSTQNVAAFALDLRDAPVQGGSIVVRVDGADAYSGPRAPLGHRAHFARAERGFRLGFPDDPEGELTKRPGLSGPITDAYYDRMIHVYGTGVAADTEALRAAAERGAKGWPLWSWDIRQEVLADTEVTEAHLRDAHVVLYATPGSNALLERIASRLPIGVDASAVTVGGARYEGAGVGVRFVYPNPLSPSRYVIVQAAPTAAAVAAGNQIPEFLPDYFVYDRDTVRRGQSRIPGGLQPPRAMGHFDARWRLSAAVTAR